MTSSRAPQPSGGKAPQKIKPVAFGRYLLLDRVAAGGMAEVWRAKQFGADDFQRIIAIKKILPHVVEDPEFIQMFKDEAKITVQLQHANIGQVYELNKVDETFYIAMDYISGKDAKTLWSYQRQRGEPLPIQLSCLIVQRMCEGLDYAHRKKDNFGVDLRIVHRDVSPQNVLISWEGEVKVIDFGIAKAAGKSSRTQAGILKGKFGYMAPEQVRGMPIDQRADVFALGVCLYELVTGERAFVAESDFSLLEMVRNVEVKPPSLANAAVPPEVERMIYKAMAKEAEDRYQWASDFSEDIQRYLLMQGRSPSRNDLAEYLKNSFPADYDRERLRMESYRDIEMPEVPPAAAAAPAAPAYAPSAAAVAAAMMEDGAEGGLLSDVDNPTFSQQPGVNVSAGGVARPGVHVSTPGSRSSAFPEVSSPGRRGNTQTAIRPAGMPIPAPPPPPPVVQKSGLGKVVAIAVALILAVVGAAAAGASLLKGSGTVILTVQPDGTEVFEDTALRGVVKGGELQIPNLPAGVHTLRLVHAGFQKQDVRVTVKRNATTSESVRLERLPDPLGVVQLKSRPGGAAIFLDGADLKKTTPAELELPAGAHDVELRLNNFKKFEAKLTVEADKRVPQEFTLRPLRVDVEIRTSPSGAKILDGGKEVLGTSPWIFKDVPVEPPFPQVTLQRKGCKDYETTVVPDENGDLQQTRTYELKCK